MQDSAQVVIIGGGIIGCSTAYHLTKMGWKDVVIVENGRVDQWIDLACRRWAAAAPGQCPHHSGGKSAGCNDQFRIRSHREEDHLLCLHPRRSG
jgi:glycine/D-amino acid oxidase-like deaminating enzyme